jgi:hypothetical protein
MQERQKIKSQCLGGRNTNFSPPMDMREMYTVGIKPPVFYVNYSDIKASSIIVASPVLSVISLSLVSRFYVVQQVCLHILVSLILYSSNTSCAISETSLVLVLFSAQPLLASHLHKMLNGPDRCLDTCWSTSGFCVFLGNSIVSWSTHRQPTVSRSSAEAK